MNAVIRRLLDARTYYRGPRDIPRILVGIIFLLAVSSKLMDPIFFLKVLSQFRVIPLRTVGPIAVFVIVGGECLAAACLLLNLCPRLGLVLAFVLNGLFVGVLALHWGKTLDLGCSCFWGSKSVVVGPHLFWKNAVLFTLTCMAAYFDLTARRNAGSGETGAVSQS